MLVIEHDMPLIMGISDRVYCLELGRVIAEGDPERGAQRPRGRSPATSAPTSARSNAAAPSPRTDLVPGTCARLTRSLVPGTCARIGFRS